MKATEYFRGIRVTGDLSQGVEFITLHSDELKNLRLPVEVEYSEDKEYLAVFCIYKSFIKEIYPDYDSYTDISTVEKYDIVVKAILNESSVIAEFRFSEI